MSRILTFVDEFMILWNGILNGDVCNKPFQ